MFEEEWSYPLPAEQATDPDAGKLLAAAAIAVVGAIIFLIGAAFA